jgi:hypothetical protein
MISDLDHVFCDDFGDCDDEIAVVGVDFIGRFVAFICKGGVLLGSPL